jgi:hypothetical protein
MGGKSSKSKKKPSSSLQDTKVEPPKKKVPVFHAIADRYRTLDEVQQALRTAGLESSNCKSFVTVCTETNNSNSWD